MIRRKYKHLKIDLFSHGQDLAPWTTTPKIRPQTLRQNNHLRIKNSPSNQRLAITSSCRLRQNQSKLSKISKIMPVVSIDFNDLQQKRKYISVTDPDRKPSLLRINSKQRSLETKLNVIRDLSILSKVYKMNKRYSLKPL